jgi:hypothetical protein
MKNDMSLKSEIRNPNPEGNPNSESRTPHWTMERAFHLAGTIQLKWGAHGPSRAMLRALAQHTSAFCTRSLWCVARRSTLTGEGAGQHTRGRACSPKEPNRSGLDRRICTQILDFELLSAFGFRISDFRWL